jgi:serine/threonine protein phosphatase 1
MAEKLLTALVKEDVSFDEDKLAEAVSAWSQDGGDLTIKQFILSSQEDQDIALSVLGMTMIYEIVKLGENKFFLSHSVPEKAKMKSLETCSAEDFLWGEPDYDKQYFEDMIIVTGHTPTGLIDSRYKGKIYMKNNHIAIDCGAVFNFRLGCLRLDDMKEFYV